MELLQGYHLYFNLLCILQLACFSLKECSASLCDLTIGPLGNICSWSRSWISNCFVACIWHAGCDTSWKSERGRAFSEWEQAKWEVYPTGDNRWSWILVYGICELRQRCDEYAGCSPQHWCCRSPRWFEVSIWWKQEQGSTTTNRFRSGLCYPQPRKSSTKLLICLQHGSTASNAITNLHTPT